MAKQQEQQTSRVKVKVLRAFYYGGEKRPVNSEIDMALVDFKQWRASGKVAQIEVKAPPPAPPDEKKPGDHKKKEEKQS